MKRYELFINDEADNGVYAISLVDRPAMESNFITLSKDEVKLAEISNEKRILLGALMIPNKIIPRYKEGLGDYEIFFSDATVEKASQTFLRKGLQTNATIDHSFFTDNISVVESWIVADETHDKSRLYGLSVPIGTWMVALKIYNDDVWDDYVKTGKVKGFSLEGFFDDKVSLSENEVLINKIKELLK